MQDYEIRKLYENSFRYLHLRLYQLNRLIEDQLPSLWLHFKELSIETHMFASQWLLTIFTARFPLYFVDKFLDLFFLLKIEAFFRVSLAILTVFRLELMSLDFEGTLKFFQNVIPRKCTKKVTNLIFSIVDDVVLNSIEIYEKSFLENNYFHDKERDRYSSLTFNESYEHFVSQIEALKAIIAHCDEERRTLRNSMKVQLDNQREMALKESETKSNIIQEYKQCFKTLESQLLEVNYKYNELVKQMSSCKNCYEKFLNNEKIDDNTLSDKSALKKVHDLELELALTKVLYAEAVCQKDDIAHQFNSLSNDSSETKTGTNRRQWFNKAMETFVKDFKSKVPNQSISNVLEKH